MGFKQDAYAKIWEIKDKGNYHEARISISKKNKKTDKYENDFNNNFVRFVGTAHTQASLIKDGDKIKIGSCEVTNRYDKEKAKEYTNYVIFSFELSDGAQNKGVETGATTKNESPEIDLQDEELPF